MTHTKAPASIFLTTLVASFSFGLLQLDVTIVNVALPSLARTLGATATGLQWVVDAYALVFAALLLAGGYAGDRYGAKRIFVAGLIVFGFASLICGLATHAGTLIAGRAAQGVGAAAMLPCSLALINHAAHGRPRQRAQAIGWWTAISSITLAAGPIVGGLLLSVASWRSIFLVNLPICLVGVLLARGLDETSPPPRQRHFDLPGQIMVIVGLLGVTGAVIEAGPRGILDPVTLAIGTVGALMLVAFVSREARTSEPMLPLSLFGSRVFSGAVFYGAVVNFGYYGMLFVLSLYLQRVLGYSPLHAGLAYLPLTATFFIVNLISGWWVGHAGSRSPMVFGALLCASGYALLAALVGPATPYWQLAIVFLMIPGGMGLGVPAMTTAVLAGVARERSGVASAVLNSVRQTAGAVGVGFTGALAVDDAHVISALVTSAALAALLLVVAAFPASRVGSPAATEKAR